MWTEPTHRITYFTPAADSKYRPTSPICPDACVPLERLCYNFRGPSCSLRGPQTCYGSGSLLPVNPGLCQNGIRADGEGE